MYKVHCVFCFCDQMAEQISQLEHLLSQREQQLEGHKNSQQQEISVSSIAQKLFIVCILFCIVTNLYIGTGNKASSSTKGKRAGV